LRLQSPLFRNPAHVQISWRLVGEVLFVVDIAISQTGAQGEVARDVLARTLKDCSIENGIATPMMSWNLHLTVDQGSKQTGYGLQLVIVSKADTDGRLCVINWPDKHGSQ
jgi:hypothetical protein